MLRIRTPAEQVADYLRQQIQNRRWVGTMPGIHLLSTELGLNHTLVGQALVILEREKLIIAQGAGKRRKINPQHSNRSKSMRIAVLLHEPRDRSWSLIITLESLLRNAGHTVLYPFKTQDQLHHDPAKIERMIRDMEVDACIAAGAHAPVLQKLIDSPTPVFSLFGQRWGLPVAGVGVDKRKAHKAAVHHLHALGHRRIVMINLNVAIMKETGQFGRVGDDFLNELKSLGMPTGPYNLPHWEASPEGLIRCLDSLFKTTPPTAVILDTAEMLHSAQVHLARMGFQSPRDVSLICTDPDTSFNWCRPTISHIDWSHLTVAKRAHNWVEHIKMGRSDLRQTYCHGTFVKGGTIGPVVGKR